MEQWYSGESSKRFRNQTRCLSNGLSFTGATRHRELGNDRQGWKSSEIDRIVQRPSRSMDRPIHFDRSTWSPAKTVRGWTWFVSYRWCERCIRGWSSQFLERVHRQDHTVPYCTSKRWQIAAEVGLLSMRSKSQLSLRALFFLQVEAAMILLFVTIALKRDASPISMPVVVQTFVGVTLLSCIVGTALSFHFATKLWFLVGPAIGTLVGLVASALTLSSSGNFTKLMWASMVSSTLLVICCCWLGRHMPQDEIE